MRPSSRFGVLEAEQIAVRPEAAIASISVAVVAIADQIRVRAFTRSRQRAIESSDSTVPSQKPQVTVTAPTSALRSSLEGLAGEMAALQTVDQHGRAPLRGLPQNEVGWNYPALARGRALEEFADGAGHRIGIERDGGHRRPREGAPGEAAEADHGEVAGNGEPAIGRRGHAARARARRSPPTTAPTARPLASASDIAW